MVPKISDWGGNCTTGRIYTSVGACTNLLSTFFVHWPIVAKQWLGATEKLSHLKAVGTFIK